MTDKLTITIAMPEHKVIPIPMSYERWMELATKQNALRADKLQRQITNWELEEIRREIYG